MPDIGLTIDKTVLIDHKLTCLRGEEWPDVAKKGFEVPVKNHIFAQWIIHIGTILAFDYFKALKEKRRLSHLKMVYYLLKENSLFLASRIIPSQKMKMG